jgi:galactose mutarotase-like enzyme
MVLSISGRQTPPSGLGHAPVLFPVVGRCLEDKNHGRMNQNYPMVKHGFARNSVFTFISQDQTSLTFRLSSDISTLASYPYLFDFYISYKISEAQLTQSFQVVNRGTREMLFCLGGHPAFAVPFFSGEQYEDYYIEFERDIHLDRNHIGTDGFFDGRVTNVLHGINRLNLTSDMFSDDALIFKDLLSRRVTIRTDGNPHTLSVAFPDFPYLGLWAKVGAPYVCIEPWLGCADTAGKPTAFAGKEGVISLPSLGKFDTSIIITVS